VIVTINIVVGTDEHCCSFFDPDQNGHVVQIGEVNNVHVRLVGFWFFDLCSLYSCIIDDGVYFFPLSFGSKSVHKKDSSVKKVRSEVRCYADETCLSAGCAVKICGEKSVVRSPPSSPCDE